MLKIVNGFESVSSLADIAVFNTFLGDNAVNILLDKLAECDWTIKDVMKGSETSKAVIGFDYQGKMTGTIELKMIKEDEILMLC